MRIYKMLLVCLSILILCSCREESSESEISDITIETITNHPRKEAKAIPSDIEQELLLGISSPALVHDSLLLFTRELEPVTSEAINLESGKLIDRFSSAGKGPGELRYPVMYSEFAEDSIAVFIRREFGVQKGVVTKNSIILDDKNLPLKFDNRISKVWPIANGYIGVGYFDDKYALFDNKGVLITTSGEYAFEDELLKEVEKPYLYYIYQDNLSFNDSRDKLVACSRKTLNFNICHINDGEIVQHQINLDMPKFQKGGDANMIRGRFLDTHKAGIFSPAVDDDHIYLLYDFTDVESAKAKNYSSDKILKLNWNGEIVGSYILDQPITDLFKTNHSDLIGMNTSTLIVYLLNI